MNREEKMNWFLQRYFRALGNPAIKNNRQAYDQVEDECEQLMGFRMYSSYESFKVAKCRYESSK